MRFHLDADLSSLFTWNTKEVFVYVTAEWEGGNGNGNGSSDGNTNTNTAVIWDSIITSPSSDYLANIGPVAMRKLRKSAAGKAIDPSRCVASLLSCSFLSVSVCFSLLTSPQRHHPPQEPEAEIPNHPPRRQDRRDRAGPPARPLQRPAVDRHAVVEPGSAQHQHQHRHQQWEWDLGIAAPAWRRPVATVGGDRWWRERTLCTTSDRRQEEEDVYGQLLGQLVCFPSLEASDLGLVSLGRYCFRIGHRLWSFLKEYLFFF